MEKLQNRQKTVLHAQSALKLFWGVSSTQNEPETYLQHHHTTKIEASKVLSKFEKIHLIFGTQLLRFGTQLLLDNVPPEMALESLLWVPRHFWGYVECFLEFKESIGMLLEAFWKLSDAFFEASKKSVLNLEISGNFYLRAVLRHEEASKPPKSCFSCSACSDIILRRFFNSKRTENIFTTSSYD